MPELDQKRIATHAAEAAMIQKAVLIAACDELGVKTRPRTH
jgi:hypothetical protein